MLLFFGIFLNQFHPKNGIFFPKFAKKWQNLTHWLENIGSPNSPIKRATLSFTPTELINEGRLSVPDIDNPERKKLRLKSVRTSSLVSESVDDGQSYSALKSPDFDTNKAK